MVETIDNITIRGIADICSRILTHKQISEVMNTCGIVDVSPDVSKPNRIYNSLTTRQKQDGCGNTVILFIKNVVTPRRYKDENEFERDREAFNEKLVYIGLEIDKTGSVSQVNKAKTISEAKERAFKIKRKIGGLNIHSEVIRFCEEEWLKDNYFHAILEVTKSVPDKIRHISGLNTDGAPLIDEAFGLGNENKPMLAFNFLQSESEISEHKGFNNFLKGFMGMYRNPKAHNPKIHEDTQLDDLTEVLLIASVIYRKLDSTYRTGYK
jgi:uncharacterized protein (TIGR02391 family)